MSEKATVLIVEDEFAIADLLELALTDADYRVIKAANGRDGLECLAKGPTPDILLVDFMMPILDGAGFIKKLRNSDTQRKIPCIMMSAAPEANVRAHVQGYAAFVRKPCRLADVLRLIADVLMHGRPESHGNAP
jgi:DNA-binding response OmpR family regulator